MIVDCGRKSLFCIVSVYSITNHVLFVPPTSLASRGAHALLHSSVRHIDIDPNHIRIYLRVESRSENNCFYAVILFFILFRLCYLLQNRRISKSNACLPTLRVMEPKSFKDDENIPHSVSRKFEKVIETRRSGSQLRNTLVVLMVLAIYFTVSTRAPIHSPQAPICSSKDLQVLSCSMLSNSTNSCCVENPGGLLLQTQLYNPRLAPADTWTIHGLWGDYCDGWCRFKLSGCRWC